MVILDRLVEPPALLDCQRVFGHISKVSNVLAYAETYTRILIISHESGDLNSP